MKFYPLRIQDGLKIQFTIAFQPIVNLSKKSIYGYQSLVRGPNNEDAEQIFSRLTNANRFQFEQDVRYQAIRLAKELQLQGMLSLSRLPTAVQLDASITQTIDPVAGLNFPAERIIFEFTEREENLDHEHLKSIFSEYKKQGFTTAINNFGAGYSGLNRLVDFQPDVIKLDTSLIKNIHNDRVKKSIVSGIIAVCKELSIEIIAEGIESREERDSLFALGVNLFQGYFFAKPAFERLPVLNHDCFL